MPTWGEILVELQTTPAVGRASPFDVVRRKYLNQLRAHTGRNVVLYATKWTQGGGDPALTSINAGDVQGFMEVMHGLNPTEGLDIVLHSPGGSAEATEAIVQYVRSKFNDVRVIVPHAAMSAATMLACAANRVVMGKHSFLGPIDPQFILQSETGVRAFAAHAIIEQFRQAQKECSIDPKLLPSWLPILRMYGPALLVQCQLATKLSKTLVSQWLAQYMFAGLADAAQRADKVADTLADHGQFMSHGRFLGRDQIKNLDIVVDELEVDQDLQEAVLSVFHAATHCLNATATVKIIENHLGKAFINADLNAGMAGLRLAPIPIAPIPTIPPGPPAPPGPGPGGPNPSPSAPGVSPPPAGPAKP
jgi:hypothetical protein